MAPLSSLAVCGLILLQPLAAADDVRFPDTQHVFTTQGSTNIRAQRELGPLLSNDSSIFGPNDSRWPNATEKYQNYAPPPILLVVQPGLESDIPTTVHVASGSGSCVGYGLISDNFVSLNVILANGSAIMVNEMNNSDLWWAMRGAGHNFGIVTSFELNVYPGEIQTW